jgi:hypothetical protein
VSSSVVERKSQTLAKPTSLLFTRTFFDWTRPTPFYSHVNKTAEIKSFTILESDGIAKGVRRLVAVTGPEADESILLGQEWTKRTDAMEKLQGKEAEIALKSFPTVRFDSSVCLSVVSASVSDEST